MGSVVDYDVEARVKFELLGDFAGREEEEVSKERLVFRSSCTDTRDEFLGNNQHMHWGLGLHIVNRDAEFIFIRDLGRNLAVDDFLKDGLRHVSND